MMTNQIRTGERINAWAPTAPIGTTVRGVGMYNVWAATVTDVNQNIAVNPTTMHGMTVVRLTAGRLQEGDSGGAIWSNMGGSNTFLGVVSTSAGTFSPMIWVPNFAPIIS
jgi:hypothetical protein